MKEPKVPPVPPCSEAGAKLRGNFRIRARPVAPTAAHRYPVRRRPNERTPTRAGPIAPPTRGPNREGTQPVARRRNGLARSYLERR
jgi:hypothetical protein